MENQPDEGRMAYPLESLSEILNQTLVLYEEVGRLQSVLSCILMPMPPTTAAEEVSEWLNPESRSPLMDRLAQVQHNLSGLKAKIEELSQRVDL